MSKIIQLPGSVAPVDPLFTARGEVAAQLLKMHKVMKALSFTAGQLDMEIVCTDLDDIAELVLTQRDAVADLLKDDVDAE